MKAKILALPFAILVAIIVLGGCTTAATPPPGTPQTEVPANLTAERPVLELAWEAPEAGEAVLELEAYGPGTDWSKKGAEAAVLTVFVDGNFWADVVLFRGETLHPYRVALGPVEAGEHRIAVTFSPDKSAAAAGGAMVKSARIELLPPGDPGYPVLAHSPVIFGRPGARFTDIPLLIAYEESPTRLRYTVFFSNEDGGTPPPGLMARWGRLTDIEWLYLVDLNPDGTPASALIQAKGHREVPFRGERVGMHPLLYVSTKNNMVSDRGKGGYRFALPPETSLLPDHSREEVMNIYPWTYEVMSKEWAREGQERPTNPDTPEVGDPRDYLYVEFGVSAPPKGRMCFRGTWEVVLKDGRAFRSDHGIEDLRVKLRGWHQIAVELPPEAEPEDVAELRFYPSSEEGKDVACGVKLLGGGKAFMLTGDYRPTEPVIAWDESFELDTDPATPEPEQAVLSR